MQKSTGSLPKSREVLGAASGGLVGLGETSGGSELLSVNVTDFRLDRLMLRLEIMS